MLQYYFRMKLLLTGKSNCGKTTLLEGFIESVPDKQGFVADEMRENGERTGFRLVSSEGKTAMLASVDSESDIRVSKYGVELESLEQFLDELPPLDANNLIYLDEIGQMQLHSEVFRNLVTGYLDEAKIYAGTITSMYDDDFTQAVRERDDVVLLTITPENREEVRRALNSIAEGMPAFMRMSGDMQGKITAMARQYVQNEDIIQLRKLFKNAVNYLAKGAVQQAGEGYVVVGNHGNHDVGLRDSNYVCDCDLFNGRAEFTNNAGECSHIQAVKLLS